LRDWDNWVVLD